MDVECRPSRWDVPFDPELRDEDVQRILALEPFASMDPTRFPRSTSLADIVRNDMRFVRCGAGDIVVREQEYGSSAFLVLEGGVRVVVALSDDVLGRRVPERRSLFSTIAQAYRRTRHPEIRANPIRAAAERIKPTKKRAQGVFLQDYPRVLADCSGSRVGVGEVFGEQAALTRAPRNASIVADEETLLLEIRWQGLRELLRWTSDFRAYVLRLYRENGLRDHIASTPHLESLSAEALDAVTAAAEYRSYGEFDWTSEFRAAPERDGAERLSREPIIAEEGHYPGGLTLIRSGFARLSERVGQGERTVSYLGRGQVYGLAELAHNWQSDEAVPLQRTLRAVGYVDVLHIPTPTVEKYILPVVDLTGLPEVRGRSRKGAQVEFSAAREGRTSAKLGFVARNRFMNGTATLVIDLERCTRCDECVRSCAVAHDGNPRFIRHGPVYDQQMVANACMHCSDPVCMIGCPTGAIQRESATGTVVINDPTCVGCGTCAASCPYNNIRMVEIRDARGAFIRDRATHQPLQKATKCDLCIDHAGGPACVRACPYDALSRVDLQDPEELVRWLRD